MSPPKSPNNLARSPADALMAVFGIPIPSITKEEIAKDAIAAVSCALNMGTKVRSLNQQGQQQGLLTVAMGVGIVTGPVVSGSVGFTPKA
jgi:adenylate cyclase